MTCPKCGAGQFAGATICNRCGTPLAVSGSSALPPIPAARTPFTRPIGVTVLAALDLLGGAAMLALSALWLTVATTEETATPEGVIALQSLAAISALFGLLYLAAGIGLLQLKPWGRLAQMTLAGFGLLGFPVGTLVSALILYYFTRPGVKVLFSGRGVNELSADEYNAVARDASKGAIVAVAVVGVVVLGVFAIGIVAAIAIPGLLRARMSANEASAIGQLRLMTSAQAVYSSFNKGQYGTLDCLAAPATCLPDYAAGSPPMIERDITNEPEHAGYRFQFLPEGQADGVEAATPSARSLRTWVYVAEPVRPGSTGRRSFCTDFTGRLCAYRDARTPRPEDGRCPADCEDLQ